MESQYFRAFYLGLTMLTTVGYGDVTPVSLSGVGLVRLPVCALYVAFLLLFFFSCALAPTCIASCSQAVLVTLMGGLIYSSVVAKLEGCPEIDCCMM